MSGNIENYTDIRLKTRMEAVQEIINDLQLVEENSISAETTEERKHALREARQLYSELAAEYVKRIRVQIGGMTEGSKKEQ